jgi:uncharacterized membrane protein YkvA (DUF1232 family)
MTSIDLSRALVPAAEHEDLVEGGFWDKVRRTLGRVPFLEHAVAAYFAAVDPATPVRVKATLFAALAYFILPVDLVPDVVAGLGFTDDGAVLFLALQAIAPHLTEAHRERARAALAKAAPADRSTFFRNG